MRSLLSVALAAAVAFFAACGDDAPSAGLPPTGPIAAVTSAAAPSSGTPEEAMIANAPHINFAPTRPDARDWNPQDGAAVSGTVTLNGTPPRRRKIDMAKDDKCANEDAREETEVIDKETKGIQHVFVVITAGHEALKFKDPGPQELLQKGCMYSPHVFGVMPGQEIRIKNGDPTTHNIHAVPIKNKEFNFTQPKMDQVDTTKLDLVENHVRIKCDVHPWMQAYAFVVPHRLFAVTDAQGKFSIAGLPNGAYEAMAWHEVYGDQKVKFNVADGKAEPLKFTFDKK